MVPGQLGGEAGTVEHDHGDGRLGVVEAAGVGAKGGERWASQIHGRNEPVRCRRLHVVVRGFRCDEGPGVELDCGEDVAITLSL